MDKQELLDKLANDLTNINAPLQAHRHINQIIRSYKQIVQAEDDESEEDTEE